MCTTYLSAAHKGQKMGLDSPNLESQAVVSRRVGAGNKTQVLGKGSQWLSAAEPSLLPLIFGSFNIG